MSWRVKMFIRKWGPVALVTAALFVGYTHWQRGGRANIGSIVTSARVAAMRVPVLGSYFRRGGRSYAPGRGYSRSYAYKRGRRGHRRHRRGRR